MSTRPCVRNIIDALSRFPFPGFSARLALATPSFPLFPPHAGDLPETFFLFARQPLQKRRYTRRPVLIYECNSLQNYSSFKKRLKCRSFSVKEYLRDRALHLKNYENFQQEDRLLGSLIVYRWYEWLITFVPNWNLVAQNTNLM